MLKRILSALLIAVMAFCAVPFSASADEPADQTEEIADKCKVVAFAGNVEGAPDGYAAIDSVVTVTLDETLFPDYTFDCWKDIYGDVIPKKSFKLIASKDVYFYPVFSDFDGTFGEWELIEAGEYCEDGDLYKRTDPVTGLTEYKKEYFHGGNHDFGPYEYVDEDWCRHVCSHCGYEEIEDHWFGTEIIEKEATHESEGLATSTCSRCGTTVKRIIPKLTEHVYGYEWTVIEPPAEGAYGKRSRKCLYCDHEETYWYLQSDFKKLFQNHAIRYQETYGGKLCHNEQYYGFPLDDGRFVYIWALQYVYAYSSGNDNGQTFIFMFIDDGDPTNLKPIYLSKTRGTNSMPQYLWAYYGWAYDFNDWLGCLDSIDSLHGYEGGGGVTLGNSMSARNSTLYDFSTKWEKEYNNMCIPVTEDPDSFLTTTGEFGKWEVYYDGYTAAAADVKVGEDDNGDPVYEQFGGFTDCVTLRKWVSGDDDRKVYNYMSYDRNTAFTVDITEYTTQYTTDFFFKKYQEILPSDEYEALDDDLKPAYVNIGNIETLVRQFCTEQGRGSFNGFTLQTPDSPTAVRVLVNGSYKVDYADNWNWYYNDAHVFFVPQNPDESVYDKLVFSWDGAEDKEFDRWEIYDFQNQTWRLLSENQTVTVNTYEAPLTGATYIRAVDHTVENEVKYHVKVTGGRFNRVTSDNTYYFDSEGDVPEGSYVCPIDDYDLTPAGKVFDHWRVFVNGDEIEEPDWVYYRYNNCIVIEGDTEFVPVYTDQKYYLDAYADNGTIYVDGEEFWGGEYAAGDVITMTTEGFEDYGYFYGWYLVTYGGEEEYLYSKNAPLTRKPPVPDEINKGGTTETLIGTETTLVFTMPADYVQIRAKWGMTETQPKEYHEVFITNGFLYDGYHGMQVTALRVGNYSDVYIAPDRSLGLDMTEWTVAGTLNGEPWEMTVDPWEDGSACFGVWGCDDMPFELTVTGTGVPHTHDLTYEEAYAPGCEHEGWEAHYYCVKCGRFYEDEEAEHEIAPKDLMIPALGHDFEVVEWKWSDDCSSAKVVLRCSECGDEVKVKAAITPSVVEGKTYYTASVVYEGETYTDTVAGKIVYGDATGDGTVNGRDVIRLRKYLASVDPSTGVPAEDIYPGADCNGDGVVDGRDLIRLRKYLANYDDETGASTVTLGPNP